MLEDKMAKIKTPNIHWIGGWVDLRAGLDDVEN
jgi:hypothetical protein